MKKLLILLTAGLFTFHLAAQGEQVSKVEIDGHILQQMITEEGDTILMANLEDVSVSSPRDFKDKNEYYKYLKYRKYAAVVYPYAKDAIAIFREAEEVTFTMKKSKRKKHMKKLQKQLEEEFEEPLKGLTKTQGKILVKMIERELDTPMYDLLKNLRGGMTATYWHTMSKFFGYNLKQGYNKGDDKIMDIVLQDFDISYRG